MSHLKIIDISLFFFFFFTIYHYYFFYFPFVSSICTVKCKRHSTQKRSESCCVRLNWRIKKTMRGRSIWDKRRHYKCNYQKSIANHSYENTGSLHLKESQLRVAYTLFLTEIRRSYIYNIYNKIYSFSSFFKKEIRNWGVRLYKTKKKFLKIKKILNLYITNEKLI